MTTLATGISAVVVYPDRARVTRAGRVALQAGTHRLEATELPTSLDPASVRAAARGTARARLLGVDVRTEHLDEVPVERVRDLEREIEALGDQRGEKVARTALLEQERKAVLGLVASTETFARGLARGRLDAAAHLSLLDGLRKRAGDIDLQTQALTREVRELDRRLERLREKVRRLASLGGRERLTAVVEIEVVQIGK